MSPDSDAKLDRIIELLEKLVESKEAGQPIPVIPPLPQPVPDLDRFHKNTCQVCGIELNVVTGYVCTVTNCPTGLGVTTC